MCTRAGLEEPSERTKQASSPRGDSIGEYASPGGTRKPSVTSLKWWVRASIDVRRDDPRGLEHLGHADAVAVVVVADRPDRDLELEVLVRGVRVRLAQV